MAESFPSHQLATKSDIAQVENRIRNLEAGLFPKNIYDNCEFTQHSQ